MDSIAVEAIAALEAALGGLLPSPVPVGLSRNVRVVAQRIRPTGLGGGFVGVHRDPDAALYGRRVSARVDVSVAGNDAADVSAYAARLSGQMLAQTRADLSQRGFQRIVGTAVDDPSRIAFDVDFEYVHVPDAGEGIIATLDLGIFTNVTPYKARLRWDFDAVSLAAAAVPLAEFQPADDTDLDAAAPAGEWAFEALPTPRIVQRRDTHGGLLTLGEARKAGTQLLWRPGGLPLALARAVMQLDFSSAGAGGVGAVFGRRAVDDHWLVLLSQANGYHVFGRRTPAGWSFVGAPAATGFVPAVRHRLTVGFYDRTLFAELDGVRTLSVSTTENVQPGEVGLLTHGNDAAAFFSGRLLELT